MPAQNEDEAALTGAFYDVLDKHLSYLTWRDKTEIAIDLFDAMKKWAVQEELTLAPVIPIAPEPGHGTLDGDGNVTVELHYIAEVTPIDEPCPTDEVWD